MSVDFGTIKTLDLACGFDGKIILQDANLEMPPCKISCILGRSGCGKSTLLRTLLLLQPPLRGQIWFGDVSLLTLDRHGLEALRRQIGVLFQGAALFNHLTLLENTAFPLLERTTMDQEQALELALVHLEMVGLGRFAHYRPASVSGGMRKRCGIARSLALDPPFLFLDEPGAGLDPVTSAELDGLLLHLRDSLGTTIVVVTHELASIRAIADHVVMLGQGRVIAQGSIQDVPSSNIPEVRDFFQRTPVHRYAATRDGLASRLLPPPAR